MTHSWSVLLVSDTFTKAFAVPNVSQVAAQPVLTPLDETEITISRAELLSPPGMVKLSMLKVRPLPLRTGTRVLLTLTAIDARLYTSVNRVAAKSTVSVFPTGTVVDEPLSQ